MMTMELLPSSSFSCTFVVNSYINIRIYTSRTPLYVYIEALTLSQHRMATKRFFNVVFVFLSRITDEMYICVFVCVFYLTKKKNARRTYKIFSIIINCVAVYVCAHMNLCISVACYDKTYTIFTFLVILLPLQTPKVSVAVLFTTPHTILIVSSIQ